MRGHFNPRYMLSTYKQTQFTGTFFLIIALFHLNLKDNGFS